VSEERTQIFRGDEAPEMAIADTTPTERRKPLNAPVDQRGMHDQKDGASFDRSIHDAAGGPSEQRQMHDADGLSDLRQLHGKDGSGDGAPRLTDGDGPADARQLHDASHGGGGAAMRDGDGPSDQRRMEDADGLSDQRRMQDAEGLSDQRRMQDAEGLSDQRRMEDADGLSDRREMRDHHVLIPGQVDADAGLQTDDEGNPSSDAVAESETAAAEAVMSDPDLTFAVEDDATPWALSIHLEERIASLGVSTTKVNRQLDKLEDSIERLAKRIAR
jgi:hypothetical protein